MSSKSNGFCQRCHHLWKCCTNRIRFCNIISRNQISSDSWNKLLLGRSEENRNTNPYFVICRCGEDGLAFVSTILQKPTLTNLIEIDLSHNDHHWTISAISVEYMNKSANKNVLQTVGMKIYKSPTYFSIYLQFHLHFSFHFVQFYCATKANNIMNDFDIDVWKMSIELIQA